MALERDFQAKLIKELKMIFKGCIIMKNDSSYIQGIPDLIILFEDKWAALEVKKSATASHIVLDMIVIIQEKLLV